MKSIKTVAILIPIHNRISVTQQGLRCLYDSLNYYISQNTATIKFEVVVIDDGSTDGSADWIKVNFPEVKLLRGDGNLWWSGAINLGARYSIETNNVDYLLLWNDDVIPARDYFLRVADLLRGTSLENTIIGSKILVHGSKEKIWSVGGFYNKYTGNIGLIKSSTNSPLELVKCDWQPGMGTILSSELLRKFNLWWDDKNFPHYHGDSDFILKYKKKGVDIRTDLNLVLYNRTELSGARDKKDLKDVYIGLTSIKSNYNIYKNFHFYSRHGFFPTAYFGLIQNYFFYIGGFIKHSLLQKRVEQNI